MTTVLALLAYAALLATVAPVMLRRAAWVERAPRLGIVTWQALSVSVLLATVCAGLAAAVPIAEVSGSIARLLEACVVALRTQYATPGGASAGLAGALGALLILARGAWCIAAATVAAARERAGHREALTVLGRHDPRWDALILDHTQAAAYCLPGRGRRVVITTGALAALDDEQLRGVLAHERAHLRGRHHLILAAAEALAAAFPRPRVFRTAHVEIGRLVELLADDAASRTAGRLSLAEALLALAGSTAPARSLAASGSGGAARVRRLLAGHRPLGRGAATFGFTAAAAIVVAPLLIGAGPAFSTRIDCCHLSSAPQAAAMTHLGDTGHAGCPSGSCASQS